MQRQQQAEPTAVQSTRRARQSSLFALGVAAEVSSHLQLFMHTKPDSSKHFSPLVGHPVAFIYSAAGSVRCKKM